MMPMEAASWLVKPGFGANEGEEDAQLCGSAQQQAGRTCDQRLKVGHGTDAKEISGG